MKIKIVQSALAAIAFVAVASSASAQLIDLRWNGSSWVSSTVSSNPYTVIGSNFKANSVFVGNGTTVERWDNTNTTPSVGNSYTTSPSQIVASIPGDYAYANLGTSMIRLNVTAGQTETVSNSGWSQIAPDLKVAQPNHVIGLTSTGQVGRVYFSGGWVTQFGATLNNPTTGYTSIAAAGVGNATWTMYSSGPGLGLDRTYYNGSAWVFNDNISSVDFNLLTWAANQTNAVFGANSSGLHRVYYDGSNWITQSINSNQYLALITDREQTNVLFGLTSTGIETIYSTDGGTTWITAQILSGTYIGLADNLGTTNALYAIIPEPSTGALLFGGLAAMAWIRRRKMAN